MSSRLVFYSDSMFDVVMVTIGAPSADAMGNAMDSGAIEEISWFTLLLLTD